ncbi:MAG: hypothetical protein WBC44_19785 [Planctomycetaceae bacterium]
MNRVCLTLARLCSAIWIGAAFLFVVTSVTEQVHPAFDGATKDTLALIRFPWFYGTGFTLLAVAFLATCFTRLAARTRTTALLLLLGAIVLMSADHIFIYRPMRELLSSPDASRGATFDRLHAWSEQINVAGFLLSLTASITLCAANPLRKQQETPRGTTSDHPP